MASEELTKGIVSGKLGSFSGYSSKQNIEKNGVIWFKEDSYKGTSYNWLKDVFAGVSQRTMFTRQSHSYMNTPGVQFLPC